MSKVIFNLIVLSTLCLCSSLLGYAQLATFPCQLKDKNILIKAKVNNSDSLDLVFDTGSTATLIDSLTAERFGIGKENRQVVETVGSGGSRNYLMATQQEIQLPHHIRLSGIDMILMVRWALVWPWMIRQKKMMATWVYWGLTSSGDLM